MLGRIFLTICWMLALPTALLTLLIVLPAPAYRLWQAAVGISEWSVWATLLGIVALICGGIALARGHGWSARLGMGLALIAIVCSLVPTVQAYGVARREGVRLSWERYFLGDWIRPSVDVQRDIVFATVDGQPLKLDVYDPFPARGLDITANDRLPAVIVIHGGSWSGGTKSDFPAHNYFLAQGRRMVFDVEYRLADANHRFPSQIADVKCAIGWVKQHAAEYRVDPNRIALMGRSAGGQLALLAAYTPNDPRLPPTCPTTDTSVQAVVSLYGPIDLVWGYNNPARPDVIDGPAVLRNYLGGPPDAVPEAYALAAPIEHVTPQSPPTLFLHGGHDQLVGKGHVERTMPKLQAAGVPYDYVYLPWGNHGFDYNPNGWGSQIAQAKLGSFLQTYLDP